MVSGIFWWRMGAAAAIASLMFGMVAIAIQVVAVGLAKPVVTAPYAVFLTRWAAGMGLRIGGVVLFAVAVLVDAERFPPLPAAFGYLGVLIPLLFMETKFLK